MKKRILSLTLALCLICSLLPVTAFASDAVARGTCGENLTWVLDREGILYISGTGDMDDFTGSSAPWKEYLDKICAVDIQDGVSAIGINGFAGCTSLTAVAVSDSVMDFGRNAFLNCGSLADIYYTGSEAQWEKITIDGGNDVLNRATVHFNSAGIHVHSYTAVVTAPTCTEGGYTTYTCDCGNTYTGEELPAAGHREVVDKAVDPSCTVDGRTEGSHCSACNLVLVKQTVVPATGHTEVTDEAVAPSCTVEGKTEGSHCSVCGEILTAQKTVAAAGHREAVDHAVAATCTQTGLTEGTHCSVCEAVLVEQQVTAALGHTEVTDEAVPATCTESGLTEGSHCSVCDEILVERQVVEATGHTWDEGVVTKEPAGEENGVCTYTCTVCGGTKEEEILPHKHTHKGVATKPTCTEEGYTTFTCSCGDTYIDNKVPALGHTEVIDEAVAVTCMKDGLTEGKHCSVCNEILVAQETLEATGHIWDEGVITREPTEEETGVRTYTCTVCGKTREEEIPVLEHKHLHKGVATDPTCTEAGYTTFTCSCGDTYIGNEVPALGHTEVVDKAIGATCTEDGLTEGTHCSVCNAVLIAQESVTARGHQYENGICTDCGAEDPDYVAPEKPSDPSEPEETDPTEPSEPEETDPTDPTEPSVPQEHSHEYGEWVTVKEPTGAEKGLEERLCACGEKEIRTVPKLTNPFSDVKESDYYYEPVLWAANRGITSGITATQFAPGQVCTRAQVVTFLWRAAGEPEPAGGKNPFTDVKDSAYYYKAVLWALEEGITSGISATQFAPNASCTRAQVVTFLWRAEGEPKAEKAENGFSDVSAKAYYHQAVLWAVENKITSGVEKGRFAPDDPCTRGQIVTFLHRAFAQA